MDAGPLQTIQAVVEPILADREIELVELTCRSQGGAVAIRLLVDGVGGVTLQQCAQANQLIGQALEASDAIEGSYTIEVSSPGLDRPLTTTRDFERAIGEQVELQLGPGAPSGQLQGMVLAVQAEAIVVKTPAGNVTVPRSQIRIAKKAIRW